MNILHINPYDLLGSSFNGYYMLDQNDSDYDFNMLVWFKSSKNPKVFSLAPKIYFFRRFFEIFNGIMERLGTDHISGIVTYWRLCRTECFKKADVVHLHTIHNFPNFGLCQLPKLCKKKHVVWTIHDQWSWTGGCIHPIGCKGAQQGCPKHCVSPRRKSLFGRLLPKYLYQLRNKTYGNCNMSLVVSNDWMVNLLLSSSLMQKMKYSVIPFGLDTSVFCSRGKAMARKRLHIKEDNFVIAFRNLPIATDLYKGIKYIKESLEILSKSGQRNITILMIQNMNGFESLEKTLDIRKLGVLNRDQLIEVYSAADVYLMPSLFESFGMMAVESMSCGTPVIVAKGTPLESIVGDMECGLVVERENGQAVADAIIKLMDNPGIAYQLGRNGRKKVMEQYSLDNCIRLHKELYTSVLN